MKTLLLLCTFWSVTVFAFDSDQARREAKQLLKDASSIFSVADRLEHFSLKFVGKPYAINGPLGEGEKGRYDQDPLYRFDMFDCTTFVETMLSLARSSNLNQFEETMNAIRYRNSLPDYFERNHFPTMQWIPNNIQKGFFSEINRQVVPETLIRTATTVNDYGNWLRFAKSGVIQIEGIDEATRASLLKDLKSHAIEYEPQEVSIEYLAIADLLTRPELLENIPSGTVVNFVRPNWNMSEKIGTNMLVSHQGLLFQKGGKLFLRHASPSGNKNVMEIEFLQFLREIKPESTLKGIHLLH